MNLRDSEALRIAEMMVRKAEADGNEEKAKAWRETADRLREGAK